MLNKEQRTKIIESFQKNSTDTGSPEVQVALLTEEIKLLTHHCTKFPKDFSTRRGLLAKVSRRKKFLRYLESKITSADYRQMVERLGLRK